MKKLLFIPLALLAVVGMAQVKTKKKVAEVSDTAMTPNKSKYNDNVDDRMKGPNGEKVYIGANGGRYYMKGTNKVYVQSAAKKKQKG